MRVNEHYQKEQEKAFEENLSFQEWLDYFMSEPTSDELDDMEKKSKQKEFYTPLNNPYYFPLQGA